MSVIADCPACSAGDHSQHVAGWNVMPGVLGGSVCDCKGDCAARAEVESRRIQAMFEGAGSVETDGPDGGGHD